MKLTKSGNRLRFSQHGVVISDLRLTPGPTHSVFDLLAATIAILNGASGPVGLLGFAAGGILAPLRALQFKSPIHTCDLDQNSFKIFRKHAHSWAPQVHWDHAEAVHWLKDKPNQQFAVLMDDLSVAQNGDITKPEVTWRVLPDLMRKKLKPGGVAIFNLMRPIGRPWMPDIQRVASRFHEAQMIELDEYENRILIASRKLPPARQLGGEVRAVLHLLGSRQADKLRVRTLRVR